MLSSCNGWHEKKSQETTMVIRCHPLGNTNTCTTFNRIQQESIQELHQYFNKTKNVDLMMTEKT